MRSGDVRDNCSPRHAQSNFVLIADVEIVHKTSTALLNSPNHLNYRERLSPLNCTPWNAGEKDCYSW